MVSHRVDKVSQFIMQHFNFIELIADRQAHFIIDFFSALSATFDFLTTAKLSLVQRCALLNKNNVHHKNNNSTFLSEVNQRYSAPVSYDSRDDCPDSTRLTRKRSNSESDTTAVGSDCSSLAAQSHLGCVEFIRLFLFLPVFPN